MSGARIKFINIRGCNGSGKTTVLRSLAKMGGACSVVYLFPGYPPVRSPRAHPPKRGEFGKDEQKPLAVTLVHPQPDWRPLAFIGDYSPAASAATTAGLDRVHTQEEAKGMIEAVAEFYNPIAVLFEGVVVSTIFEPWLNFSRVTLLQHGEEMTWAFLDTPLEVCLQRIQARNGGQPIKEDLVADKHRTIARVRDKALAAEAPVVDLHWETALSDLRNVVFRELQK